MGPCPKMSAPDIFFQTIGVQLRSVKGEIKNWTDIYISDQLTYHEAKKSLRTLKK